MNEIRNKISLLAAQGVIGKDLREILYGLCDGIERATHDRPDPDENRDHAHDGNAPLFVEPEDTGDGVRGIDDPNRENSLDIEQPSLARPTLRDA